MNAVAHVGDQRPPSKRHSWSQANSSVSVTFTPWLEAHQRVGS